MNGFYSRPYNSEDLQQLNGQQNGTDMMDMMGSGAPGGPGIMGAQSLDDIVNQNEHELRRRSMPIAYGSGGHGLDNTMRRVSMMDMMEFGGGYSSNRGLEGFQFNPTTPGFDQTMSGVEGNQAVNEPPQIRRSSAAGLSISTHFPNRPTYNSIGQQESMYASSMQTNTPLDMNLNSPYITSGLSMPMDMGMMSSDLPTTDKYGNPQYGSPYGEASPVHQAYSSSVAPTPQDAGGGSVRTESLPQSAENSVTTASSHPSVAISRANSYDKSQANSRADSASAQAGSMAPPPPATRSYSPKPLPANTGPLESINGNILPWAPPAGKLILFKQFKFANLTSFEMDGRRQWLVVHIRQQNTRTHMLLVAMTSCLFWYTVHWHPIYDVVFF
jgi:hypothetical protein